MQLDAAEAMVEAYCNRRLMKTVLSFKLSAFPSGGIVLPFSPVISVDSITYYDSANSLQTWNSSNYTVNLAAEPCRIEYVNDSPGTYDSRQDAVIVAFTVGYSSSATLVTAQAAVPGAIKQAILRLVGDLYAVRQDQVREKFTSWMQFAYPYRVFHYPTEND